MRADTKRDYLKQLELNSSKTNVDKITRVLNEAGLGVHNNKIVAVTTSEHYTRPQLALFSHMRANKAKRNLFITSVTHTSLSGLTMGVKFLYNLQPITELMAAVLKQPLNKDGSLRVKATVHAPLFSTLVAFLKHLEIKGSSNLVQHFQILEGGQLRNNKRDNIEYYDLKHL